MLIDGAADIDFGHVLGNFKEKTVLGVTVRRERAPFVYTKQVCGWVGSHASGNCVCGLTTPRVVQMAHVMKGDKRVEFEDKCCRAYNILRKHASRFLCLYMLVRGIAWHRTARRVACYTA